MKANPRTALAALAGLLVLYALAGFLIAPRLVRDALLKNAGAALVTRPSLGAVRVNPFALSLTLERLAVPDPSGQAVVGFDRLYLRFDPLRSIAHGAWTLAELRLEKPAIRAEILPDRTLNLTRLLKPQPPAPPSKEAPPKFTISHLLIADGSVSYGDRSRTPYFAKTLSPIRLDLVDFGTRHDDANDYTLDATTDARETLTWRGHFTMQPFAIDGQLTVGTLQARTIADFLGPSTPFVISRGTFGLGGRLRINAASTPAAFTFSSLAITASDLALTDRATSQEALAARTLETRQGTLDVTHSDLSLGHVRVDGARVAMWMLDDGTTSFQRWAQAPAAADSGPPFVTRIPDAAIHGLAFTFEDRRLVPAAAVKVHGGEATLANFSTVPGTHFTTTFACSLEAGGHASARGDVVPSAPSADLQVDLAGFAVRTIQPWVNAFVRLDLTGGTAAATGRLQFDTQGAKGPLLRFTGEASSLAFSSTDRHTGEKLLAWDALALKGFEYDVMPGGLVLHELDARKPFLRAIVAADGTTNLQALAVPPDSVPRAFRPAPGDTAVMPARIDLVKVTGGILRFSDLTLRPNFAIGVQGLEGDIRELSSAEAAHAAIQLDGKVDAYAPVHISGTLNPLNSRGRTDLAMAFKNIELTTFTPYSGKFMGYRIQKGKLDLDLDYTIENRRLEAKNHVFMRQLTLGDKVESPDATHLPVRFAVALLKDRDGNIDLNLPVKGSLDDPKFSVMPIIMKVLIGLVTKAVASPFALMHAAFGGSGGDAAPAITFPFGSAEFDTASAATLTEVRKGLADKPALRLEIEESGDAERDSLALLARRFDAALRALPATPASGRAPEPAQLAAAQALASDGFEPADWADRLARAYAAQFGRAPELPRIKRPRGATATDTTGTAAATARLAFMSARVHGAIVLDPADLASLGHRRARRIQGFLLADSTIAPERVFIVGNKGTYRPDSLGVKLGLTLTD